MREPFIVGTVVGEIPTRPADHWHALFIDLELIRGQPFALECGTEVSGSGGFERPAASFFSPTHQPNPVPALPAVIDAVGILIKIDAAARTADVDDRLGNMPPVVVERLSQRRAGLQ